MYNQGVISVFKTFIIKYCAFSLLFTCYTFSTMAIAYSEVIRLDFKNLLHTTGVLSIFKEKSGIYAPFVRHVLT